MNKINIIGITGGVGSGKSTLSKIFSDLGYATIDADQVSRQVMSPPSDPQHSNYTVYNNIVSLLGKDVVAADGTLDRGAIRRMVFANIELKRELEKIIHPAIQLETQYQFDQWGQSGLKLGFYEASLLLETNRFQELQGTILVLAPHALQLSRLLMRGLNTKEAQQIIDAQMKESDKLKKLMRHSNLPHWIINNDSDSSHLNFEATRVLLSIKNQFKC